MGTQDPLVGRERVVESDGVTHPTCGVCDVWGHPALLPVPGARWCRRPSETGRWTCGGQRAMPCSGNIVRNVYFT